jgi:ubiquinone/menaquinone biosynthesis C-methylase UbiE
MFGASGINDEPPQKKAKQVKMGLLVHGSDVCRSFEGFDGKTFEYCPYAKTAKSYDEFRAPIGLNIALGSMTLSEKPLHQQRLLDIGCGTGTFLGEVRKKVGAIAGLEYDDTMLSQAKARLGDDAELVLGSAEALPFDDNSFDACVMNQVVHHLPKDDTYAFALRAFKEANRVLKPGGVFILNTSTPEQQRDAFWWMSLFPRACDAMCARFPSLATIKAHLKAAEFEVDADSTTVPLNRTLMAERKYLEHGVKGAFYPEYRCGDSSWSMAEHSGELEDGLKKLQTMIDAGTAEFWLEGREILRNAIGQATFLTVRKVELDIPAKKSFRFDHEAPHDTSIATDDTPQPQNGFGTISASNICSYRQGPHALNLDALASAQRADLKVTPETQPQKPAVVRSYRQGPHGMNLEDGRAYRQGAHGMNLDLVEFQPAEVQPQRSAEACSYRKGPHDMNLDDVRSYRQGAHGMNLDSVDFKPVDVEKSAEVRSYRPGPHGMNLDDVRTYRQGPHGMHLDLAVDFKPVDVEKSAEARSYRPGPHGMNLDDVRTYRQGPHGMNLDLVELEPAADLVPTYRKGPHGMNLDSVESPAEPDYRPGPHGVNLDLLEFEPAAAPLQSVAPFRQGPHGMNLDLDQAEPTDTQIVKHRAIIEEV